VVVVRASRASLAWFHDATSEALAGAAADIDVRIAKHVGHDVTNDVDRLPVLLTQSDFRYLDVLSQPHLVGLDF